MRNIILATMCQALLVGHLFGADPTPKATVAADQLKKAVKTFRLDLSYRGQQDKPYYRVVLTVEPIQKEGATPFVASAQISEDQARKIIDHLAQEGFLDHVQKNTRAATTPMYTLTVSAGDHQFQEDIGWGLKMIKRLDGLRALLDGDAAKQMDFLLTRLSGHRKQWEQENAAPK